MTGVRILLVEDEAAFAIAVQRDLDKRGASVIRASTLAGALAAVDEGTYDLLILDKKLPDGDGLDLLRLKHSKLPAVCIVLSGHLDWPSALESQLEGALVLPKRWIASPEDLVEAIERVHRGRPETRHAHRPHEPEGGSDRATLRHQSEPEQPEREQADEPLSYDRALGKLHYRQRSVDVTNIEGQLFELFDWSRESFFSARQVAAAILGRTDEEAKGSATKEVSRLRQRLRLLGAAHLLETKKGWGWRLRVEGSAAEIHSPRKRDSGRGDMGDE